jgi:hypothetical protein
MIEVFEGKLGGGKTYSATVRIVHQLRKGGVVATNIELNRQALVDYCARKYRVQLDLEKQLYVLTEEQLFNFHSHIPMGAHADARPLIVIDEAHLWFNSRDWAQASRDVLKFLTQSRKLHVDIILISQSALNLDKQFIRMVQYVWRFRDMDRFKIPGLGISYPTLIRFATFGLWNPSQILVSQFDFDGRTLLEKQFVGKDRHIFALYQTNSLLRPISGLSTVVADTVALEKVKSPPFFDKTMLTYTGVAGILWVKVLFFS